MLQASAETGDVTMQFAHVAWSATVIMRAAADPTWRWDVTDMNDWNKRVIEEFRANGGKVSGQMEGWPLVLLHHVGAKSGVERVTPLVYQPLGDASSVAIFASKAGAPTNPDWFHNLVANPSTVIEIGSETRPVIARVAEGEERDRIFETQKQLASNFAEYEKSAGSRTIPVVVLDPAA